MFASSDASTCADGADDSSECTVNTTLTYRSGIEYTPSDKLSTLVTSRKSFSKDCDIVADRVATDENLQG